MAFANQFQSYTMKKLPLLLAMAVFIAICLFLTSCSESGNREKTVDTLRVKTSTNLIIPITVAHPKNVFQRGDTIQYNRKEGFVVHMTWQKILSNDTFDWGIVQ